MDALVITLIVLGLASLAFLLTGWLDAIVDILIRLVYKRHKKMRLDQRPSRIFLIRHGESQANIDPSKYSFQSPLV